MSADATSYSSASAGPILTSRSGTDALWCAKRCRPPNEYSAQAPTRDWWGGLRMPREARLFTPSAGSVVRGYLKFRANIAPRWIKNARGSRKRIEPDIAVKQENSRLWRFVPRY